MNHKQIRHDYHLTQSQAAELAGVKLRVWQYYETGERVMPPLRVAHFNQRLAEFLAGKKIAAGDLLLNIKI